MADNKFAAYICSGCGIGDKMDVTGLEKVAKTEGKMTVIKNHPFLCNAEGVQMIRDDIGRALACGDRERGLVLKLVLRNFVLQHPACEERHRQELRLPERRFAGEG